MAAVVVILIVVYGVISFAIASGVTKYERKPQEDSPKAYGLQFEDIEFVSMAGDVTLSGWYLPREGEGSTIILVHGIIAPGLLTGALTVASCRVVGMKWSGTVFTRC